MKRRNEEPEAAIRLIGLAARAGSAVPGTERVRSAARRGELAFALVAEDARRSQPETGEREENAENERRSSCVGHGETLPEDGGAHATGRRERRHTTP